MWEYGGGGSVAGNDVFDDSICGGAEDVNGDCGAGLVIVGAVKIVGAGCGEHVGGGVDGHFCGIGCVLIGRGHPELNGD